MLFQDRLCINTFDEAALPVARELGLGLEIEEYLWTYTEEEIAEKQARVSERMAGFSRFSFHGTAISRDVAGICRLSDEELLALYNQSYGYARFHGIQRIVFHSDYLVDLEPQCAWTRRKAAFWKNFLGGKPADFRVYVENFIDDTPDLMAQLCDLVDDSRFRICLDTGHAGCNSRIDLLQWIAVMGKRIGHVHLHNNDGLSDRHWPLGEGTLRVAEIIEHLLDHADAAVFVLECDLEQSLRWLRQNGFLQ